MAGRGADIRLGGSGEGDRDEVAELGGLTSSAPAGTTAAGSTTSCAAGPAGRATRAARCSSSAPRTRSSCATPATKRRPPSTPTAGSTGEQVDRAVGPRAAGRRGRQLRDPPQHLAVRRPGRAAAPGAGRAPRASCSPPTPPAELLRASNGSPTRCRGDRRGARRRDRPPDRAVPPRPGLGRPPRRCWPMCAKASTCGRWAGRTRSTSSTARRSRRSASFLAGIDEGRSRRSTRPDRPAGLDAGRRRPGPADRDVDLHGPRQPVRLGDGAVLRRRGARRAGPPLTRSRRQGGPRARFWARFDLTGDGPAIWTDVRSCLMCRVADPAQLNEPAVPPEAWPGWATLAYVPKQAARPSAVTGQAKPPGPA